MSLDQPGAAPMPPSTSPEPPARRRSPRGPLVDFLHRHPLAARAGALAVACLLVGTTAFVVSDAHPGSGSPVSAPPESPSAPTDAALGPEAAAATSGAGPETAAPATSARPSSPPDSAWSATGIPPYEPAAKLVASDLDRAGIAVHSRFTLTSLTDVPAATLAKGIVSIPAVDFAVARGGDPRTAVLAPKTALMPATAYRVTLRLPDASLAGSWLFRTEGPLHVASTHPGDQATEVPLDTGIEVTFDQDGVGPIEPYFSIAPPVAGRFEQHGRTWAFVAGPLAPATIYTVTVRRGVTLTGSDQVLEEDVHFAFETVGVAKAPDRPPLDATFARSIQEVAPAERPIIELYVDRTWDSDDTRKPLSSVALRVFRLPGLASAVDAYRTLEAAPDWARRSDRGLVPTAGLELVAAFTAPIRSTGSDWDSISYVEFPTTLEPGWYLVVRPRTARDQQVLLQVTDVATYLVTTTTRSVVWVNDVTSGKPIVGATLRTVGGAAIAATGSDGIATPVIPPGDLFIVTAPGAGPVGAATLPGRAAIIPVSVEASTPSCTYPASWYESGANDFWHVLATDRRLYRATDEIDAWGMVRRRDGGALPSGVELRISTMRWECETAAENAALAIVRAPVSTGGRTGTFATPIQIRDLPPAYYRLELWAGDARIASREFEVGEVRKPSYTFDVTTDRHLLVEGDAFEATVKTAFFDQTPLPGLTLQLQGDDVPSRRVTTAADGSATVDLVATWGDGSREGSSTRYISVTPDMGEEADIPDRSTAYVVLPARLLLEAKARLVGGRVSVTGSARVLDQAGSERRWVAGDGSDWAPTGPAAAGSRLHVTVEDGWYVRVRTGRAYDFISKRTYDTYRYDEKTRTLAGADVTTAADGTFAFDVSRAMGGVAAPKGHHYDVRVSGRDVDGRGVAASAYAYGPETETWDQESAPRLQFEAWPASDGRFAVGDRMRLPLEWGSAAPPSGGSNRYLFLTATRGLRDAYVSTTPVFVHPFAAHDVPNTSIQAVWFTGHGYVPAGWGASASVDSAERGLRVTLTPDAPRHAPGDGVKLDVRTTDPAGRPVAATVILRAIDEKLYAMDAAYDEEVLEALYEGVPSGIDMTYSSHESPLGRPLGGQGDTTGGGGGAWELRQDFRDSVLFERITTDAAGRGSASFRLSDDITSWRVSGAAFTADLRAGAASVSVAVGLPLFIEVPLAPDYLVSDRPTLMVRAYGPALSSGQAVTFTVSAPSLGLAKTTVTGRAFRPVAVPLPALKVGDHALRVEASASSGGRTVGDALVRTVHVVGSRFTTARTAYVVLPKLPAVAGTGLADYVFMDAGRGKYLWPVRELAWGGGDRVDQALGALIARDVLKDSFGITEDAASGYPSYLYRYQKPAPPRNGVNTGAGIALLPYGSPDIALSARVSLLAGDLFDIGQLRDYFSAIREDPSSTREQKNLALAGLAGIDASVAPDVTAALGLSGLTVREQLYLALAAAILGDGPTAAATERALVKAHGERLGEWVRLHVGSTEADVLEATSLLALVAVTVGDPIADGAEAYVEEHFTSEDTYELQKAAFLRAAVERAPASAARFEYTVGGGRRVVDLAPGETYSLRLTPAQRAALTATTLSGKVGVAVRWEQAASPSSVAIDRSLAISRAMTPSSPISVGSVVTVVLTPKLGGLTTTGCYRVVDLAPSGLLPLGWAYGGTHGSEDVTPWEISGQKVVFCTVPSPTRPARLVYYARVVTPGTYTWEPARMQADRATESGAITAAERVVIE